LSASSTFFEGFKARCVRRFSQFTPLAVDGDDRVPGFYPGLLGRLVGDDIADLGRFFEVYRELYAYHEYDRQKDYGQDQVHRRAGGNYEGPFPYRLVGEGLHPELRGDLFSGGLADHLHVPAERQKGYPVLGLAPFDAYELGTETEGELFDPDSAGLSDSEMPELVYEYQYAKNDNE
jgi:hypothetical protein